MSHVIRIAMNGVTGRMGRRQHLERSIVPLREEGWAIEPVLVGRDPQRLGELAAAHGITAWSTDLDTVLSDPTIDVYFDAQVTARRYDALTAAITADKAIYAEKPTASTHGEAEELARRAAEAGITAGVVHDKLYLPGIRKLRRLVEEGFFGRILSVKGDFGYWVFTGEDEPAQRPSWNYQLQAGGGITSDMFCHWSYLLESLIGRVDAVTATVVTHVPRRWDEQGRPYDATADDAAYAVFEVTTPAGDPVIAALNSSWTTRVHRDELVEFQVDGTAGSAVAGLFGCVIQPASATPRAVWDPDVPSQAQYRSGWLAVPDREVYPNAFRAQWEEFLSDVVAGRPHRYDLASAARGVALAEAGLRSSAEGRRVALAPVRTAA